MYNRVLFAIATLSGVQAIKSWDTETRDMRSIQRAGKRADDAIDAAGSWLGSAWGNTVDFAGNAAKVVGGAATGAVKAVGGAVVGAAGAVVDGSAEAFYQTNLARGIVNLAALRPSDMIARLEQRKSTAQYFLRFLKESQHASEDDIDVKIAELEIMNAGAMIDLIDEVDDNDISNRNDVAPNVYATYQAWKGVTGITDSASAVSNYVSDKKTRATNYFADKKTRASKYVTSSAKALKASTLRRTQGMLRDFATSVNNAADNIVVEDSGEFDHYDEAQ